jgi:hypothetical protein
VNQDWIGTGYTVFFDDAPTNYVGTLYRLSMTNRLRNGPFDVSGRIWLDTPFTNMSRIADGIVHLRVRPCAGNGFPIISDGSRLYAFVRTNANLPLTGFLYGSVQNAFTIPAAAAPDQMLGTYFVNTAVPAYVELEIGILEPKTLQRYRAIPPGPVAAQFLASHVADVHIFRQRVPIRNVDLSVFP